MILKLQTIVVELWGEYFRDLYSEQPTECFNETFFQEISSKVQTYFENSDKASIPELEKQVTFEKIREQINTLKCGKAPGPDRITNEHILYSGDQVIKCLCKLFDMILKAEYLPVSFRNGIIIPLYKGSNKDKTEYLPVSFRHGIIIPLYKGSNKDKTEYLPVSFRHGIIIPLYK
ncbi:unnamed protein product [Mytilus coruscus]|uniref:Reverse transcriptase domain-containing protein n=1 Tax=Mytilus coruscus TaxID=42192 RepID=A0A6J8E8G1_MYTCO|nr:unnamed protein product [Mytilus coruscus]